MLAGDSLLWAHKMEGVGNTFTLTAEKSPVFVEDVRAVKLKMAAVNTRTSTRNSADRRTLERFQLSSNDKARICASMHMPMDLDVTTKAGLRATYYA